MKKLKTKHKEQFRAELVEHKKRLLAQTRNAVVSALAIVKSEKKKKRNVA